MDEYDNRVLLFPLLEILANDKSILDSDWLDYCGGRIGTEQTLLFSCSHFPVPGRWFISIRHGSKTAAL